MIDKWLRRPQVLISAIVFLVTLGVYVATMNPTTPFWDAGEFITTSHIVGVPHQPGTPLYVLMGRVFDVVLGSADITEASMRTAWAVNFMSAFFSALAVMLVYLIIWELARRADPDAGPLAHIGGVVGAFFLAFSETFWNNAIEAEVYGLSAFMMATFTWLAIRWYDHREHRGSNNLLLLMIYLLGLGVGFHLGSIFAYPGVFLMVILASRRHLPLTDLILMTVGGIIFILSTAKLPNELVIFLLAVYLIFVLFRSFQGHHFALIGSGLFFIGLTVHIMMLIRAGASPEPFINQTAPDNFDTLLSVIRREQYPPLNPFERRANLFWQFEYYYTYLFKQFYFLGSGHGPLSSVTTVLGPIFLALVGLFQGLRRIWPLIMVPVIGYLLNGEGLTLLLNFTSTEVRDRDYFFFAAFMFFAVFIGLGASALLRYLVGGEGKSAAEVDNEGENWRTSITKVKIGPVPLIVGAFMVIISLLPAVPAPNIFNTKYFEHDNSENRIAYEYAWNILAGLDEGAIIFTNGDNDTFPIWYLQEVEKFRTDVTVVNLSLVNLPWYVKQLKNHPDKPLHMKRSEDEIDALRHRVFEDPKTGERTVLMIKDYVVHDIITANYSGPNHPVFFAVTIPQDNMSRYFSNMLMEGMAYRLTDEAGPEGMPRVDAGKVLENIFGVYRLDALMDGNTPERQRLFGQMSGLATDSGEPVLGKKGDDISGADLDSLSRMIGGPRSDVFRNTNARHLLGNYPAALNRAGYESYLQATQVARTDTTEYRRLLNQSLVAFRASLAIAPFNELALEYYPLLLIQAYQDEEAGDFLRSLQGNVPQETEERILYNTLRSVVGGGASNLALEWLGRQVANYPDRLFYYQMQFHMYQALGWRTEAEGVLDAWERRSGERPPEMVQGLEDMRQGAMDREQERIDEAVGGDDEGQ